MHHARTPPNVRHPTPRRLPRRWLLHAAALTALPARAAPETPGVDLRPEHFPAAPLPATLTLPDPPPAGRHPARGLAAVVLVPDQLGADARAEPYVRQLLGAHIAVLELLLPPSAADALSATARALAADPRIDGQRLGVLGFGQGAAAALAAGPFGARALLYPDCAGVAGATAGGERSGPVLLLHGAADRASPPAACAAAAEWLERTGNPVRRIEYAGATYAWDYPPFGVAQHTLLPAPGAGAVEAGPGSRVQVVPWPALTAHSAAQVASFFARELGEQPHRAARLP